jgi:hypothetical protein
MSDLVTTQRWIQGVITDHDGVPEGLAPAAGAAHALDVGDVVHGSEELSAAERLGLYNLAYRRRLVGCLRESYPGLQHALGDELFTDFALDYLRASPPRGYTLTSLGAGWPAYLEASRPDRALPVDQRERWPDFLVDLARLERTFCEVYDGPGVEGETLPTAADVATWEHDPRWAAATVTTVVCLRLLDARFPVGEYLVAVRRGEQPALPAPAARRIAVSRREYGVTITDLATDEHALLVGLLDGATVHAAADVAGLAPSQAWRLLGRLAERGLVAAASRPERPAVQSTRGVVRC